MKEQKVKDQGIISLRTLFALSVAVNVGLVCKFLCEGEHNFCGSCPQKSNSCVANVRQSQRSRRGTSSAPTFSTARTKIQDWGNGVINLGHGDPTMYEGYWKQMGDSASVVIPGWQSMSYFSDVRNICWFLDTEFANAVIRLHKLVGNANTDGRHIVVGTGSTQLFQALLYALCLPNASDPINVVAAAPYYSSYPLMTDYLKSGLYRWAGDAYRYDKDQPYIELVTFPNNPEGSIREAVVNGNKGILIHDLAYYWPQYTPITFRADYDIMMFTVSKSTGHAGTRLGWALVKDEHIARKMTNFIELNTIGVSKDSQIRATKILNVVSDSHSQDNYAEGMQGFFEYGYKNMENRWKEIRTAVNKSGIFRLPNFPLGTCSFSGRTFETQPAFAWLKCEIDIEDCESFLHSHKILTRSGKYFGSSPRYVRISMLPRDNEFDRLSERLSSIDKSYVKEVIHGG